MTTIYIDESGFTGDDLYNPEQPYFVIASSIIGNAEAEEILRRCFPRYQGAEFKFTNIWKKPTHRAGLRAFAAETPTFADKIFVWIIDKRFCLMTKMFDYLIEPAAYKRGYDFYAGGWGLRYMNTIHRDLLRHGSASLYDDTVQLWDTFARKPNSNTMAALRDHLDRTINDSLPPISTIFTLARRGLDDFLVTYPRLEDFTGSSEIQVTSIFSTVGWWRQKRPEDFDFVHDESSAFLHQRDLWMTMMRDIDVPPIEVANGSMVELPLRIKSTTAVRSQDSFAVQLCDVLAGFAAKAGPGLSGGPPDPFIVELVLLGAGELTHSGIIPHALYTEGPPPKRNGPDMVDRMVELIQPYLEKVTAERIQRES